MPDQTETIICGSCFEPAVHFTKHFPVGQPISTFDVECDFHYDPVDNPSYYKNSVQITREEYLLCLIKQKL